MTTADIQHNGNEIDVTFSYDESAKTVVINAVCEAFSNGSETITIQWDDHGRLAAMFAESRGNVLKTIYTYDEAGNCISEVEYKDDEIYGTTTYVYDDHGNEISCTREYGDRITKYEYVHTYDDEGNITCTQYLENGEESVKLDTPRRRALPEKWSQELWEKVKGFAPAFACFAGFTALSNIARELPCLNVHPGDLTRCAQDGARLYAGLHVLPVEKAILNGETSLRSSFIWVQPNTGNGSKEMDAGPVLGVSAPIPVELGTYSLQSLEECRRQRVPGVKCTDALRRLALEHIERLKICGDHQVFPRAVADFAANCFRCEGETLFYNGEKVLTVEYSASAPPRKITL
jgi:hypothetical protein